MPPLPTRKDVAEFYRLALAIGLRTPTDVVAWADLIVAADDHSELVFLELSGSGRSPAESVRTLLHDVPGTVTDDLPVSLLLGLASRLLAADAITEPDLLRRLYSLACLENMPGEVDNELRQLEDALCLAQDGIFGTSPDVARDVREFLARYEHYCPPGPG